MSPAQRRLGAAARHLRPVAREPPVAPAGAAAAPAEESSPDAPPVPFVDVAQFRERGFCVVKNMLRDEDLKLVERDYDVLVNAQAQDWLAAGHLTTTHADLPFDKRLAAIAADLPQAVVEDELRTFVHSIDTMTARCRGTFDFFFSPGMLAAVEQIIGPEITLNPIQHIRPYIPHRYGGGYGTTTWHQVLVPLSV